MQVEFIQIITEVPVELPIRSEITPYRTVHFMVMESGSLHLTDLSM